MVARVVETIANCRVAPILTVKTIKPTFFATIHAVLTKWRRNRQIPLYRYKNFYIDIQTDIDKQRLFIT